MLREEAKQRQRMSGGDRKSQQAKSVPVISPDPIGANAINNLTGETREIAAKAVGVSGFTVQRGVSQKAKSRSAIR